jgi:hypothetical protein
LSLAVVIFDDPHVGHVRGVMTSSAGFLNENLSLGLARLIHSMGSTGAAGWGGNILETLFAATSICAMTIDLCVPATRGVHPRVS